MSQNNAQESQATDSNQPPRKRAKREAKLLRKIARKQETIMGKQDALTRIQEKIQKHIDGLHSLERELESLHSQTVSPDNETPDDHTSLAHTPAEQERAAPEVEVEPPAKQAPKRTTRRNTTSPRRTPRSPKTE